MTNNPNPKSARTYDLEERTAKFGENVIKFCKKIPENLVTKRLIPQMIAAGTSVGANYAEADDAESKRDFRHKIGICKKESRESKHFLRMLMVAVPGLEVESKVLWSEAKELNLIFNSIYKKLTEKMKSD